MQNKDYLRYHFSYVLGREKICILAIMQALITDGENPVITATNISEKMLIAPILRFETFNLFKLYVSPISIIPNVCARYS